MIDSSNYRSRKNLLAILISRIFDTPIMMFAILFTFLVGVKPDVGWLAIVFSGDILLPIFFWINGYRSGQISDIDITIRTERIVWYLVSAILWVLTLSALLHFDTEVPERVLIFQTWLVFFGVLNALITLFWKISSHAMLATSLCMWLSLLWNPVFLILALFFIPAICWARLVSGKHTLAQLLVGIFLMVLVISGIWLFFKL